MGEQDTETDLTKSLEEAREKLKQARTKAEEENAPYRELIKEAREKLKDIKGVTLPRAIDSTGLVDPEYPEVRVNDLSGEIGFFEEIGRIRGSGVTIFMDEGKTRCLVTSVINPGRLSNITDAVFGVFKIGRRSLTEPIIYGKIHAKDDKVHDVLGQVTDILGVERVVPYSPSRILSKSL